VEWVYACYVGIASSGRGRALTRVNRGWGGVGGWVRDLSERRAREMGGNKGSGAVSSFWTLVSMGGRVRHINVPLCRSNYATAPSSAELFFSDPLATLGLVMHSKS
jgi:hypothetical protein